MVFIVPCMITNRYLEPKTLILSVSMGVFAIRILAFSTRWGWCIPGFLFNRNPADINQCYCIYHVTIVAFGHGLLQKFGIMVMSCTLDYSIQFQLYLEISLTIYVMYVSEKGEHAGVYIMQVNHINSPLSQKKINFAPTKRKGFGEFLLSFVLFIPFPPFPTFFPPSHIYFPHQSFTLPPTTILFCKIYTPEDV